MPGAFVTMLTKIRIIKNMRKEILDKISKENPIDKGIEIAGYGYDSEQDIFYCNMNPWQRGMGYSRLYDEGSAPFGMILDCEPIYFKYKGKVWLIELWKGQYDLTCGGEVGVYTADEPIINLPIIYKYMFYQCAADEEKLQMSFYLERKDTREVLFKRNDNHWWLAGFKLGEYAEPSDLVMHLTITLKDEIMRDAFVKALENMGYSGIKPNGNQVKLIFDTPHSRQPFTRIPETDRLIQMKNKLLCDKYKDIVKFYDNIVDKINAIKIQAPEIYQEIMGTDLGEYFRSMKKGKES